MRYYSFISFSRRLLFDGGVRRVIVLIPGALADGIGKFCDTERQISSLLSPCFADEAHIVVRLALLADVVNHQGVSYLDTYTLGSNVFLTHSIKVRFVQASYVLS